MDRPTPHLDEIPGGWIDTPADPSRVQSYIGSRINENSQPDPLTNAPSQPSSSSLSTAVPSPGNERPPVSTESGDLEKPRRESIASSLSSNSLSSSSEEEDGFVAVKAPERPRLQSNGSKPMTEDDLFRSLSKRRTSTLQRSATDRTASESDDEQEEINRLMSRMFGRTRQESSEEEKTRHSGVVFKNLTVKGT